MSEPTVGAEAPDALTRQEVETLLGVSRSRVLQFVRDGELTPSSVFGQSYVFQRADVLALLARRSERKRSHRGPSYKMPAPRKAKKPAAKASKGA